MSVRGVLMTEPWEAEAQRVAAAKVIEIRVQPKPVVCTRRVAECAASRGDWVCGACGKGFVTAAQGAQCNVCEATVVLVAYE